MAATIGTNIVNDTRRRLEEFFRQPNLTKQDISDLQSYLDARPERHLEDIDYISEFRKKEDLVRQILGESNVLDPSKTRISNPSTAFFGLLVSQDKKTLETLKDRLLKKDPTILDELDAAAVAVISLSSICHNVRQPSSKDKDQTKASLARSQRAPRLEEVKKRVLERDGEVCAITGSPHPEGAHFWPYSASSQEACQDVRDSLHRLRMFVPENDVDELMSLIGEHDMIDSVSNMICLNRTLHDYMARGYFVLNPMSRPEKRPASTAQQTTPQTTPQSGKYHTRSKNNPAVPQQYWEYYIRLRFEWLQKSKNKKGSEPIGEQTIQDLLNTEPGKGPIKAQDAKQIRSIGTGDVIEIVSDNEDDLPNYEILKLIVLLARIRSIAGAAEPRPDTPATSTDGSGDGIEDVEDNTRRYGLDSERPHIPDHVSGGGKIRNLLKKPWSNSRKGSSDSQASQQALGASPKRGIRRRMSTLSLRSIGRLGIFNLGNDNERQPSRDVVTHELASGAVGIFAPIREHTPIDTSLHWPDQNRAPTPDPAWAQLGIQV